MIRCAIIACDHGLGHVRRSFLFARALGARGCEVTVFAPRSKYERVTEVLGSAPPVVLRDFETATTPAGLRRGDRSCARWHERLPDLADQDVVVCDNLPEVLMVRPDAILAAQFMWHEVLTDINDDYRRNAERLLDEHDPPIVGSDLFTMSAIRRSSKYWPVGLYGEVGRATASRGQDLLLTGGSTPIIRAEVEHVIARLLDSGPGPFRFVHVEPALMPLDPPFWMRCARYDSQMYIDVSAAICRPGLGVLTDLLSHGARPWCLFERGNAEMAHNVKVLVAHDLGGPVTNVPAALNELRRYAEDEQARLRHARTAALLSFDGAAEAAEVICKHVESSA